MRGLVGGENYFWIRWTMLDLLSRGAVLRCALKIESWIWRFFDCFFAVLLPSVAIIHGFVFGGSPEVEWSACSVFLLSSVSAPYRSITERRKSFWRQRWKMLPVVYPSVFLCRNFLLWGIARQILRAAILCVCGNGLESAKWPHMNFRFIGRSRRRS